MPNTAPIRNILARTSVAMTQDWQELVETPADRDGFFLFNSSPTSNALYRLLEVGGTPPSGAGTIPAGSGVLGPLETRFIGAGADVGVYAYAISGTDPVVIEETD